MTVTDIEGVRFKSHAGFQLVKNSTKGRELFVFHNSDTGIHVDSWSQAEELAKNNLCIVIERTRIGFSVYSDPFRSIPIYIATRDGKTCISTTAELVCKEFGHRFEPDPVGIWETILYENPLWSRTLFIDVYQLPGACVFTKNTDGVNHIKRYWDFNVLELSNRSEKEVADSLVQRIDELFGTLPRDMNYLMGLSGGLDSRNTLGFLTTHVNREKIHLYTYGYNQNIIEYQSATVLAKQLGVAHPEFYQLAGTRLTNNWDLVSESSGAIGVQHSHTWEYLKQSKLKGDGVIHVSNAYTDALFGWSSRKVKVVNEEPNHSSAHIKLAKYSKFIPGEVEVQVLKDLDLVFASYFREESNISCADEFFYITERNQKFHNHYAFVCNQLCETKPIFLDFKLLNIALSVPLSLRFQKRILDSLIKVSQPTSASVMTISSRDFNSTSLGEGWEGKKMRFLKFRLLNWINAFLVFMTSGNIQLHNEFQTEMQPADFHRYMKPTLNKSLKKLIKLRIVGVEAARYLKRVPIRPRGLSERFQVINVVSVLRYFSEEKK